VGEILPGGGLSFTHILLWKTKAVSDEALIRRVETDFRLNCLTRARFGDNTRGFLGMFMLPLLTAGMLMGFLVGCITIGITLYTSVLERFKEYGTMKALGATGPYLYGLLLKQALISLGVGAALGFVLAMAANRFINEWVPGMTAGLDGAIALETMAAGLAMVGLSTALPMWRLIKIDPMEAFRA
jgi:putative ABC transport system permease protein